jgi:hypothetical protein
MAESGECRLHSCPVFKEDLLYFFYGRPAYRVSDEPMSKSSSQPVVLLFDPMLVKFGKRLFPFDSGAFHTNRLDSWMDPEMKLPHFELKCGGDGAMRFVAAFFESNDNYLRTRVRSSIKKYGGEFEVSALVRLLHGVGQGKADDRRMAVELQLDTTVQLCPGQLKAVIYPDELEESDWFSSFLTSLQKDVALDSYKPHYAKLASEYQVFLEERARALQEAMGVV